jgi:hypothetical protein
MVWFSKKWAMVSVMMVAVVFFNHLPGGCVLGNESLGTDKQGSQKPGWLEGTGKELRIKIGVKVVAEDNTPVESFKLEVR